MRSLEGLSIGAEGTGISQPLSEQINLVGSLLGEVIQEHAGRQSYLLVEELRQLCKKSIEANDPELRLRAIERISVLDLEQIMWLLRSFTVFFHLVNQAEQQEITRINRERARSATADEPRDESVDEAIARLKSKGIPLEEVRALLDRLDIQPTITAHPTEARRRSILYKQQHIGELIFTLRNSNPTPDEESEILDDIYNQIVLLLATDEIRAERPSVIEEVENGLYFIRNSVWQTIPKIHEDLRAALLRHYGEDVDVPICLRFRSWIGSDRDGNPKVTADVTRQTLKMQRRAAASLYLSELRDLRRELSISERQAPIPPMLNESLARDENEIDLPAFQLRQFRHEPYRRKISYMMQRLEMLINHFDTTNGFVPGAPAVYSVEQLRADLNILSESLRTSGFSELVDSGRLGRLQIQSESFGLHLSALDVRQHSEVHESAISEILKIGGVFSDYASLPEDERVQLLSDELRNARPLLPHNVQLSESTQDVVSTFQVMAEIVRDEPSALGSFIVSMTHTVSDLLEVLILAKEVGLWSLTDGVVSTHLDVVPLFETIEDLQHADTFLAELYAHPVYKKQLAARNNLQEIMLGYSDSNKDGGYWMANWALHLAQERIGQTCVQHGVDFRLFHGRGGTVGRGGGRAGQAISAMPKVTHNGKIRFTEQGEVISFRYALPEIAHRHLEQITHATILAPFESRSSVDAQSRVAQLLGEIADTSMQEYRRFVNNEKLWEWYTIITPIGHISRLPIASRPISRKSADEVDFEGLRAIPWVFAWTQTRYVVPGWFGSGKALRAAVEDDPDNLPMMQKLYREWPFFTAVINNAQLEMGRARLEISAEYSERLSKDAASKQFHELIAADFRNAEAAILKITGQAELLDDAGVIKNSIRLRNSYTDVLNLLQIELMTRRRASRKSDDRIEHALLLSVNGIAAAMQSTG